MSRTIFYELRLAASGILTGIGLMMVYDLLRIFRMFCPHNYFVISIEDFFYWIYSALLTFSLLYEQTDGVLRGYVIGSILLGMAVYRRTAGSILLKYLKKVRESIRIKTKKREHVRKRLGDEEYERGQKEKTGTCRK